MKIMLLAGAGTSIELGVPAMQGMAREFLEHSKQWNVEPTLVSQLIGDTLDIEYLIEGVDNICLAQKAFRAIGSNTDQFEKVQKIRSEVEWFVQHAAERVVPKEAELMWGGVLLNSFSHQLELITTNYDRAIELSANALKVDINDGYEKDTDTECSSWKNFEDENSGVLLAKLHGSTDWYEEKDTNVSVKLRHPMPLFGGATLNLLNGKKLGTALILPSREKLLNHSPYPRLSQAFHNSADCCDLAIFVGTSLRDKHLKDAAETTSNRVPVFIVSPDDTSVIGENIFHIRQCASTFLISTLPNALNTDSLINTLKTVAAQTDKDKGIFTLVNIALDHSLSIETRCHSIESLEERRLAPHLTILKTLINDKELQVARYSLGLMKHSPHFDDLLEEAELSPYMSSEAYEQDIALLKLMTQPN